MTLVVDIFKSLVPPQAKTTHSGWTSFNCPCCSHLGHRPDRKKRGGVRYDHGIAFHCFNCGYTTGWQPGKLPGEKFKNLCKWLGASDQELNTIIFEAMKTESEEYDPSRDQALSFQSKALPKGSLLLVDALEQYPQSALPVAEYLLKRGLDLAAFDYHWSDSMPDRVILPFKFRGRLVGHTARKIRTGHPKYLSDQPSNFVFNLDQQSADQRYVFVCEGVFDAIAVGGVALLHNEVSEAQARLINSLGCEVIVIPDHDTAGLSLVSRAAELGWSVAFPTWDDNIKDAADAVAEYGRLFVTVDAIKTAQQGAIKIKVATSQLAAKIARISNS